MTGIAIDSGNTAPKQHGIRSYLTDGRIAAFALFAVIAMQFPLIWQRSINWDEFFHYSQIVALSNGTLVSPLQTLQARLFYWVLWVSGSSIDHVVIIRSFMFAFELLAAASIAGIAARFTDRVTGLIAAMAYVGGGFVFQHGFSFRTDPMVAGLLMACLWILLCSRLRIASILFSSSLLAVAAMLTIKSVLFAPVFAGVVWLRWNELGRSTGFLLRVGALGILAAFIFAGIYLAHSQGLSGDSSTMAKGVVNASANKMFGFTIPYIEYAAKQVVLAPLLAVFILLFPGTLLRSKQSVHERVALAGMFAPILTLLFYHNTAPYYYVFMLPSVVAASSIVIVQFRARFNTTILASLILFSTAILFSNESGETMRKQRVLVAAAEEMFPDRVAYIDCCGFLGSFTKANTFMTPWGIELYKSGFYPSIRQNLTNQPVPLVMDNAPMFTRLLTTQRNAPEFIPEDASALRRTYIHFWGPFWVAGKMFVAGAGETRFEILVPGPYTLRGGKLTVDGIAYADGQVIQLARGVHSAAVHNENATLIWGDHLVAPEKPVPDAPFWTPF